jgi:hypothetical protein
MALPDRFWSGACTFRGPERALPLERWLGDDGAPPRDARRGAALLVAFLERGEEKRAFDEGDLPPAER